MQLLQEFLDIQFGSVFPMPYLEKLYHVFVLNFNNFNKKKIYGLLQI